MSRCIGRLNSPLEDALVEITRRPLVPIIQCGHPPATLTAKIFSVGYRLIKKRYCVQQLSPRKIRVKQYNVVVFIVFFGITVLLYVFSQRASREHGVCIYLRPSCIGIFDSPGSIQCHSFSCIELNKCLFY